MTNTASETPSELCQRVSTPTMGHLFGWQRLQNALNTDENAAHRPPKRRITHTHHRTAACRFAAAHTPNMRQPPQQQGPIGC
jgi:hypothetical protein